MPSKHLIMQKMHRFDLSASPARDAVELKGEHHEPSFLLLFVEDSNSGIPMTTTVIACRISAAFAITIAALVTATLSDSLNARELRLDQPISAALRNATWKQEEVNGIEFRFGNDTQNAYPNASGPVPIENFARTFVMKNGRNIQREDNRVCDEAFRNALTKAAEQARKSGANAVVNITSKFLDIPLNSKSLYTCNSGTASATVDLVVQFATLKADDLKVSTQPMLPMANLPGAIASRVYPPATVRASINDAEAIPFIGGGCRKFYSDEWLKFAVPRAFAISQTGHCHSGTGFNPLNGANKDPAIRALEGCSAKANMPCQLYAVDNNIVHNAAGISEEDLRSVAVK
jgi:hypothetical protein